MKKFSKLDILSAALMTAGMLINFAGGFITQKRDDEKRKEEIYNAVADYMAKKES